MLEKHGRLELLVNNAGITRANLMLRMNADEWDRVLDTNLTGVGAFLCSDAAAYVTGQVIAVDGGFAM